MSVQAHLVHRAGAGDAVGGDVVGLLVGLYGPRDIVVIDAVDRAGVVARLGNPSVAAALCRPSSSPIVSH